MARDRLPELQKALSVKYNKKNEEVEIEEFIGDDNQLTDLLKEVEKIRRWLSEINEKTVNMRILYSDPLYNVSQNMQSEMDGHMTECSKLGMNACAALKEFENRLENINDNSVVSRITKIQYVTMKSLCEDALNNHETFLNKFKTSKMSLLRQQIKLTNQNITDEECHRLLENNKTSIFVENYQLETRETILQLQDLESRHKELIKIEQSLLDLKEMFTKLAVLVSQQQEQINTVEYFATQATGHVDNGNVKLQKGLKLRKKAQEKKSMIICILVGILIVIFLIIFMNL